MNLPIALVIKCAACGNEGRVRAVNAEAALDVAMAGGWAIVNRKHQLAVCPLHNPARVEFGRHLNAIAAR